MTPAAPRETLPAHLIALAPGWNLWRTICLRGTGFPVSLLEQLGAAGAAAAADDAVAREAEAEQARIAAFAACIAVRGEAAGAARRAFNRAVRLLAKGRIPDADTAAPGLDSLVAGYRDAAVSQAAARDRFEESFMPAVAAESEAVARVASDPLFREAVTWQNRKALHESLLPLARSADGPRNKRRRRQERMVLQYLQRYAAKNESIGFFGPIGWGAFVDGGPAAKLEPGPRLVAENFLHFEHWAIETLARTLRDPRLWPWLAPRKSPLVRIADGRLLDRAGRAHEIRPPVVRLIALCDGATPAREITARLTADPDSGFADKSAVYDSLRRLARRGVVLWYPEIPFAPFPGRALNAIVDSVGDAGLRSELSAFLAPLFDARKRVEDAIGDPDALDAALNGLEECFTRLTGAAGVRSKSAAARGRTLLYLDCRRDVAFEMSPEPLTRLGPPLSLVLDSARWFMHAGTGRILDAIGQIFADSCRGRGTQAADFQPVWRRTFESGVFSDAYMQPVTDELQARWTKILALKEDARRAEFRAESLRAAVAAEFAAPGPAHRSLPYHAPDVMIAAGGVEAVRRGDYRFVLGEVHAGFNTLVQTPPFMTHPHPEALVSARRDDNPGPKISPLQGPESQTPSRFAPFTLALSDFELADSDAPPAKSPDFILAITDLVAEKRGGALVVRTRDGAKVFDVLELFAFYIRGWASRSFHMLPPRPHMPRITIDSVVIARESWSFPVAGGAFAAEKIDSARFLGARRWAHEHGFPRRVFMRFPHEKKPVCIDLESPGFVDLAAHLWRAARDKTPEGIVTVTEMLPDLHECWLTDAEGNRYTSELRLVAVDSRH